MSLAVSHSLRTFKERRAAKMKDGKANMTKWLKVDRVVDSVYVDLVNGLTRSDVTQKLIEGLYDEQEGKGITYRVAVEYVNAAQQRMMYDFEEKADILRADLYTKMMSVYSDCIEKNDRYNALIALDKIMKLTGVAMDKPKTQVNLSTNGDIKISFGFNKEEQEEEEVDDVEL